LSSAPQYLAGTKSSGHDPENLIAERNDVDNYRELIRHFADDDPGTKPMLERIL